MSGEKVYCFAKNMSQTVTNRLQKDAFSYQLVAKSVFINFFLIFHYFILYINKCSARRSIFRQIFYKFAEKVLIFEKKCVKI